MKKIYSIFTALFLVWMSSSVSAQCTTGLYGAFGSLSPTCNGTFQTATTCGYRGEYSTITVTSGNTYTFLSSIGTDWVTITDNIGGGTVYAFGASGSATWVATFSETVRLWTHLAGCGSTSGCMTRSVMCSGGAPPAPSLNCLNNSSFGTLTMLCNNAVQTISTCSFAGEYSTVNGLTAGRNYTVTNSAGDHITVRFGAFNGAVVAQGNGTVSFTAPSTGTYYMHWNLTTNCGT